MDYYSSGGGGGGGYRESGGYNRHSGGDGGWRDKRDGGRRDNRDDDGGRYEHGRRGRGGRGGRGGRRGGGGRRRYHDQDGEGASNDYGHEDRPRGRGRGRPPGLRGKEIGLYYARKSMAKREKMEEASRAFVQMDESKEVRLASLLHDIRSGDQVAPQPSRSYRDAFDDDSESDESHTSSRKTISPPSYPSSSNAPDKRVSSLSDQYSNISTKATSSASHHKRFHSDEEDDEMERKPSAKAAPPIKDSWDDGNASDDGVDLPKPMATSSSQSASVDHWSEGEDSDEINDEELMMITKEAEAAMHDWNDQDEDDPDLQVVIPGLSSDCADEDSRFIAEFHSHNMANRNSQEKLNETKPREMQLARDPALDGMLERDLEAKLESSKYQRMQAFRRKLPSWDKQQDILHQLSQNQVLVISGETGCGKTTQVGQFILDDYIKRGCGSMCRIVCTQPRRISAISVAERVADERAEPCGGNSTVGYSIRLEQRHPRRQGSILFCTTGIMLKWLASDPWLAKTTHVILDEIHERDLQSDFLMIILKDLRIKRPDLKLILMSATLNAEMFSQYFGNAPMLNIPGFTYPVTEYLLEDVIEETKYGHFQPVPQPRTRRVHGAKKHEQQRKRMEVEDWVSRLPRDRYSRKTQEVLVQLDPEELDLQLVSHVVEYIVRNKPDGAILVFLPGWEQIKNVNDMLNKRLSVRADRMKIIPLHSMLPTVNQRQVFERPPPGVRKIVIATNIAETSITIDDVVYVVDCGKIKMKNFDAEHNIGTLNAEWVSRANARQRRGRAGRVQAGECYHLYTALQETKLEDYQLPEMLRTRLEELCLQIKLLKLGYIEPFVRKAMQPPSMEALKHSIQTLRDLNALDELEDLTPLGFHLAKMPVDPHTGKMLLFAAMFCCLDPILTIAASLSFKDAFYIPMGREKEADRKRLEISSGTKSDHIMLAYAFEGWERAKSRGTAQQYCWDNFLSAQTLRMLSDMRKQFTELLCEMKFLTNRNPKADAANKNSNNIKLLKAVICAGLYPNVAKLKNIGKRNNTLMTKTEHKVAFHPKSVNESGRDWESSWFVYHLKMRTAKIYVYDSSMVSTYALLFFGGNVEVRKDKGQDCIVIDDWIVFRASRRVGHLVKELRVELDKLLEYKITHPGVTNWNPKDKEGALMAALIDLMTTEDQQKSTYKY